MAKYPKTISPKVTAWCNIICSLLNFWLEQQVFPSLSSRWPAIIFSLHSESENWLCYAHFKMVSGQNIKKIIPEVTVLCSNDVQNLSQLGIFIWDMVNHPMAVCDNRPLEGVLIQNWMSYPYRPSNMGWKTTLKFYLPTSVSFQEKKLKIVHELHLWYVNWIQFWSSTTFWYNYNNLSYSSNFISAFKHLLPWVL